MRFSDTSRFPERKLQFQSNIVATFGKFCRTRGRPAAALGAGDREPPRVLRHRQDPRDGAPHRIDARSLASFFRSSRFKAKFFDFQDFIFLSSYRRTAPRARGRPPAVLMNA